jgi:hypothetical protein
MLDWWSETEHAIVDCLESGGPMSPEDLAQRVGISEGETTAFLCMLAREKKVVIRLVGLDDKRASQPSRATARGRGKVAAAPQATYAGER